MPITINWNSNRISDEYIDSSSNFVTFYFYNDTTIYIFKSLNKYQNDSILFAVENVEEFKGNYKMEVNNVIVLNMHRVIDSFTEQRSEIKIPDSIRNLPNSTDFILDTLNVQRNEKGVVFFYRKNEFGRTNKFTRNSIKKLHNLIHH